MTTALPDAWFGNVEKVFNRPSGWLAFPTAHSWWRWWWLKYYCYSVTRLIKPKEFMNTLLAIHIEFIINRWRGPSRAGKTVSFQWTSNFVHVHGNDLFKWFIHLLHYISEENIVLLLHYNYLKTLVTSYFADINDYIIKHTLTTLALFHT